MCYFTLLLHLLIFETYFGYSLLIYKHVVLSVRINDTYLVV